jgi:hypothetical protein
MLFRCLAALLLCNVLGSCATTGFSPIPYAKHQNGARDPFGFYVRMNSTHEYFIEFQGTVANNSADMRAFVSQKANEICRGQPKRMEVFDLTWFVSTNALGMPAIGIAPTTGRAESFPKVIAQVVCTHSPA